MRWLLVLGIVGHVLRGFSLAFLPPGLLALLDGDLESIGRFGISASLTLGLGLILTRGAGQQRVFYRAEALAVVALTWLAVALCGALPYGLYGLAWEDALFESMSGFTTTGATVLADFASFDRAFFLWRSMSQWFGGLGVIALFIVVLPRLGIAGRQLFFAEASAAPSEAVSPQVRKGAERLWLLYTCLTLVLAGLLFGVAGLSWFDSLTHALTTMAAGGFSPNPQSLAGYQNPAAEWILCAFMLLAGTSFTLQYKVFTGRPLGFFRDGEFLFYAGVTLSIAFGLAWIIEGSLPSLESLRVGLFQSTSVMSSTGFASRDYNQWSDAARSLLVLAMLVGGCAGSAAGGPKVVRYLLVFKHVAREIKRTLHPRAVLLIRHRGQPVSDGIMRSVFTLVVLYMVAHLLVGLALVWLGSDLVSAFSAALACVGNVGPAFGDAGPMGSFAHFSTPAKLLLFVAMWVGRLEIVTVLALLHLDVLRQLRA